MTNLNIIPNFDKKTAKFEGAIAAGENIHVNISNIGGYIVGTENLRLRAVGSKGETLAQFPLLGDENLNWVKDGDTIECDLNLNTVQMLEAVPPAARVMILFVLDNPEDEILYFKSFVSVDHWPRRVGEDEPVDLGGYTDFVQETLRSIESIEDRVDEAEKIATDAQESASGSVKSAAAYAEAAKGYAQKANDVLKGAATKEEVVAVNKSLTDKADADKVWLRGGDVTGETNFAQSIKVNKIAALDGIEGMADGIKFDAPIVSNTVNYGENEPAFAVIDGNMIQAFSNDGDSNSDLVIRGRSFYFQGNSYDYPQSPPAIYTEGDVVCEGEIFTSGLTFRINDGLDGGSLIWEDYNHMLHVTSACSVEDQYDWEGLYTGISFHINTYNQDPWSGEQLPFTYTFSGYGEFDAPSIHTYSVLVDDTISAYKLHVDSYIQLYNYVGEEREDGLMDYVNYTNEIQSKFLKMTRSLDGWPVVNTDGASITPAEISMFHSETNCERWDENGNYITTVTEELKLKRSELTVRSYDDSTRLNTRGLIIEHRDDTSMLRAYTILDSDGLSLYTVVDGEEDPRPGVHLDSSDFKTLRTMIDEYNASKGA